MPGEMYDQLISEPNSGLRWFCESCEKMAMEKNSGTPSGQNDKLDALIVVIEKLMARYESVEKKLESKSDVDQVERLEQKVKELEEKLPNLTVTQNLELVPLNSSYSPIPLHAAR